MTVRTIIKWPDSKLSQIAENVDPLAQETKDLVQDLLDTMTTAFGIGLASTQVGIAKSICIIRSSFIEDENLSPDLDFKKVVVLINPEIVFLDDKKFRWKEACLSIPGIEETVVRHYKIQLTYENLQGEKTTLILENKDAAVIQHEVDHLFGKVFLDRLPAKKRKKLKTRILQKKRDLLNKKRKKLKKIKKDIELEKKQSVEPPTPGFRVFSKTSITKSKKKQKRNRKLFGKNKSRKK